MSLAHKLYNIGKTIVDKKSIESLIVREYDNAKDYQTVVINLNRHENLIKNQGISKNSCKKVL